MRLCLLIQVVQAVDFVSHGSAAPVPTLRPLGKKVSQELRVQALNDGIQILEQRPDADSALQR